MTADPHCGCITCGDEATPMRVLCLDEERGLALCEDDNGTRATVETALVLPVTVGDALLVHAGAALARLTGDARPRQEAGQSPAGHARPEAESPHQDAGLEAPRR